jgi:hypothetical protein
MKTFKTIVVCMVVALGSGCVVGEEPTTGEELLESEEAEIIAPDDDMCSGGIDTSCSNWDTNKSRVCWHTCWNGDGTGSVTCTTETIVGSTTRVTGCKY